MRVAVGILAGALVLVGGALFGVLARDDDAGVWELVAPASMVLGGAWVLTVLAVTT